MRKLVYHVAITLDNYIAHEDGSADGLSGFAEGDHTDDYLESLKGYDTVVMGRSTYEFGYQFGLEPGTSPYPHMRNYIFSKTLNFDTKDSNLTIVDTNALDVIKQLKDEKGTDIYLCGGGKFAGFLAEHDQIDELRIKLYPLIFGKGIRLFGSSEHKMKLSLSDTKTYQTGAMLLTYRVNHS